MIRIIVAPGAFIWWRDDMTVFHPSKRNEISKISNPFGEWLWVGRNDETSNP